MADRLTQLQDTVNQQAEHFCNSIGILQQCSVPSKFPGFERTGSQTPQQNQQEDYAQLFSTLISRCAKDIDTLIESLPSEESSIELQVQALKRLEIENQERAEKLEEVVRKGELLLEKIQAALSDIAQSQLDMQYSSSPKKQWLSATTATVSGSERMEPCFVRPTAVAATDTTGTPSNEEEGCFAKESDKFC